MVLQHQPSRQGQALHRCLRSNPLTISQIPSITYGGPDVPSHQPSAESEKLSESIALLEFISDIYPEANLLPADPILRAKARRVISLYENYVHDGFKAAVFLGQPAEGLLQALGKFQSALPPTGFAIGQYSIADCAVAPFLVRMMLFFRRGLGGYTYEEGDKVRQALSGEEYARFRTYIQDLTERPSFHVSWDEVSGKAQHGVVVDMLLTCHYHTGRMPKSSSGRTIRRSNALRQLRPIPNSLATYSL